MNPEHTDPRAAAQRRLEAMVGRGELTLAEFSDRAGQIWAATSPAELEVALSGLPVADQPLSSGTVPVTRSGGGSMISVDEGEKRTSILDTLTRRGRWQLTDGYHVTTWAGEIFLDARDAVVAGQHTHVTIDAWAGSARLLLPPGVSVHVTGNRTWCELAIDEGRYQVEGGPHLDLEINGFMSTIKVKVLASGERIPSSWKWF